MNKTEFTTYDVGKICGVSMPTIIDWIEQDKLKAYKTIGGHRRVKKEDLVDFLKENKFPVPKGLVMGNAWKILVIDDDELLIKFIVRALPELEEKNEVKVARDGFDAGKQVLAFRPHVVILDLMLPGIDGFDVCRNIRNDKSTRNIRILAVTGYDTEENRKKIFKCGADLYLAKPFEASELREKVRQLLK